jgi:hypothetical protein
MNRTATGERTATWEEETATGTAVAEAGGIAAVAGVKIEAPAGRAGGITTGAAGVTGTSAVPIETGTSAVPVATAILVTAGATVT